MNRIIVFSTNYNELHVPLKHMTKFLEILEDSKYVDMQYTPGDESYSRRVGVVKDPESAGGLQLGIAPDYWTQEDFDYAKDVERAEAQKAESDSAEPVTE